MKSLIQFFKSLFLLELLRGMRLTGRHFFARKVTQQYPEEKNAALTKVSWFTCLASLSKWGRALYCL